MTITQLSINVYADFRNSVRNKCKPSEIRATVFLDRNCMQSAVQDLCGLNLMDNNNNNINNNI